MRSLGLLALLLLSGLLASCGNEGPVKLGFIGGLSGRFADLGTAGRNGAIIAVDWRNARGGVGGRPVVLLIRDDEHLPGTARDVFGSLVDENVSAVVGPMTSAMASEILPLADRAKMVLVGGTIVSDRFNGKDDYLIRVIAGSRHYATMLARLIQQPGAPGDTEVFYDLANRDYAEEWARSFALEASRLGNPSVHLHAFDGRSGW
jgi:branched-chain amino acid transport system substrate-binding protein